jgi:diguanylate cyclase (GGDEF)-like protein
MIDVDGLRALNATRGLKSGDELLKVLGVLATGAAGTEGVVCRYGGDELVLLLPRGAEEASRVATGFADSVRQLVGFGEPGPSVSIGIATAPEHAETADELVFRADQALAEAKTLGRGQHAVWSPALRNQRRGDRLAGVLTGRQARDYRHVNALLDTVSAVSRLAPLDEILTEVVDRCRAIAGAERGLLLLKDGERWAVRVARGPNGVELSNPPFAASIAEEALTSGVTVSRLAGDDSISPSAETLGLNAVLCAPLQGDDVPHGVIYVDTTSRREPFERATLAFFDALTAQVLTALRNASLYERLLQRAKGLSGDVAGREQELVRLRSLWERDRQTPRESPVEGLIGSSPPMQEVFRLLQSLKGTSVSVVVEGESGTGKELVSRAIHEVSGRAGPLITVNCGAIVATLFESELFGHVQGSFTGALGDRVGLLEAANGGTLFLDEIGELPLESQAKLLRALQEGEIRRLGDSTARSIDVRIVAATNRDLLAMVEDGEFREDLFYRLAVFRLRIPPLRERVTDIPEIVSHLLSESQAKPDARTPAVSPAAMRALSRNPWPGNVRQLRNVLDRALVLAQDGVLLPEHVETPSGGEQRGARDMSALLLLPLKQAKAAFSAVYAQTAIDRAGGSVPEAAKAAGVTRQTLYRILADKQS